LDILGKHGKVSLIRLLPVAARKPHNLEWIMIIDDLGCGHDVNNVSRSDLELMDVAVRLILVFQ